MAKYLLPLLLMLCIFDIVQAQTYTIQGTIIDSKDSSALIGASVSLNKIGDSIIYAGTTSDINGHFLLANIATGNYLLNIAYVGYVEYKEKIEINNDKNLNTIYLNQDYKLLNEVEIVQKQIRIEQLGDTSQFHAGAFKTNSDATAEELLTKMPGITSENGTVKVNGEEVKKVLVDGKPFFGDDPRAALQNLPADMIDKVQVFDRMSDQSTFTGFDDGNGQKTINFITKSGMTEGSFGKVFAGYGGIDNRYNSGLNYSNFKNDRRFSILAMSNNVNQQNFNIQDLMNATGTSGGGRGGGGPRIGRNSPLNNFLVGQQNGISTTTALGINFSDKLGKNNQVTFSGSYFFNASKNNNNSSSIRNYISSADSGLVYSETKEELSKNYNHRINTRIEYMIDSSNIITITPSLSTQQYTPTVQLNARNTQNNALLLSSSNNNQQSKQLGINFSNDILYQHKFTKSGRTISINTTTGFNTRRNNGALFTENYFVGDTSTTSDTIDQTSHLKTQSYTLSGNIVYTEPIKKNGQLSFNYTPSYTNTVSDKETQNFNSATQSYDLRDSALSNYFNNKYLTNRLGISYKFNNKKINWTIGINGQHALLQSEQVSPSMLHISKHFLSILPSTELNIKFSVTQNLRFHYRTSTNAPSISQLQNVVDNSNSLILSSGNPRLQQSFSQNIGVRYSRANTEKATNLFVFGNIANTIHYIANATTILTNDTTINGIEIASGRQFIQPVNLDGYWNTRTFITYGFPLSKIKSNMNINTGFVFTKTPSLIDNANNYGKSYTLNGGIVLSSNISKKIDFTVSYSGNYNLVRNTLQQQNNSNFFSHNANVRINYQFWKGFVFSSSFNNILNVGGSSTFNTNYFLLNTALAYKLLKSESLELKFSVNDILNQNQSITRNVTDTYTEDVTATALKRYFMGTITYTFKKVGNKGDSNEVKPPFILPPGGMPPPPLGG